ncbi:hypothetical protein NF868_16815 [Bacillus zhangzhouensis]|nr:hypothetical protein NF868_16815 [Bacillus zhangzhouensis]
MFVLNIKKSALITSLALEIGDFEKKQLFIVSVVHQHTKAPQIKSISLLFAEIPQHPEYRKQATVLDAGRFLLHVW